MQDQYMFSSEVELGNFLGSIDVIPDAYRAIPMTSATYKLHKSPGYQVLAFHCSPDYTARFLNGEFDLVSSDNLKTHDFISTKLNKSFSINEAAVDLFEHLPVELQQLENELINSPLVVTGQSLGGYLAVLFALRLQHAVDVEESNDSWGSKRPICITFGSPLVGDEALQCAISERPRWKSCFLNVVEKTDLVASFFSSNSQYRPFGTFLFCTGSGGHATFEDQDSVLAVLDAVASSSAGNMEMHDYGKDLRSIRRKVLYRGVSELGEFNFNPLRAGITLQFKEVGMLDVPENNSLNDIIKKLEEKQAKMIKSKRINYKYEPTKKLNDMKISLTYMEWYMKSKRSEGRNYYDRYKNAESREERERQQEIVYHQRKLNQYWKTFVEEKDQMPQTEGAKLRKRWLFSGTNYRRIVEPLDIAEYYKKGKKNYITNRPNHYKLIEKWSTADKKELNPSDRKNKAASLTEDSCFWAHVEEALISLRDLKNGVLSSSNAANIEQGLEGFEGYLMHAIIDYSVSPDVFLEGSSLMKWWREYKAYKGSSYASEFAQYMNKESYKSYK